MVTFEVWCAGPPLAVALSSELPWQKEQMPRFEDNLPWQQNQFALLLQWCSAAVLQCCAAVIQCCFNILTAVAKGANVSLCL